jgi:hypothetical protein
MVESNSGGGGGSAGGATESPGSSGASEKTEASSRPHALDAKARTASEAPLRRNARRTRDRARIIFRDRLCPLTISVRTGRVQCLALSVRLSSSAVTHGVRVPNAEDLN